MSTRLGIGDFARATHLSVKALRHYHELNLLVPVEIDPHSGYRYYDVNQVPMAQVIFRLRDLGMPLDQVKAVVDAPDLERRNTAIAAHLTRMEEQLSQTRATVRELRGLLQSPPARLPVRMRSLPMTDALAVRERVTVADFPQWWADAFGDLFAHLRTAGVRAAGTPGALYSGEVFEDEEGEITAFVPIDDVVNETSRLATASVPAVEVASVIHEGPLGRLDTAYGALGVDLAERGVIRLPGPLREYYLVSPFDEDDEAKHRTEVCWPVFRTAV